jgi:hypothetical protein
MSVSYMLLTLRDVCKNVLLALQTGRLNLERERKITTELKTENKCFKLLFFTYTTQSIRGQRRSKTF